MKLAPGETGTKRSAMDIMAGCAAFCIDAFRELYQAGFDAGIQCVTGAARRIACQ